MALIKNEKEIALMAEAGRKLARVLAALRKEVKAGVTTAALDARARELLKEVDAVSAFLGYKPHGAAKPYPAVLCVSVNDTVVHGVPGEYVIRDGDLVKIDMGLVHERYYSDSAITIGVGKVAASARKLIQATEEALRAGIKAARAGNTLGDIGFAVSEQVHRGGFSVIQQLTGHGIGTALHEDPYVFNVGRQGEGDVLKAGMVIAIEPMVAMGKPQVKQLRDDSFATKDGSLSAHFEHTVAITSSGPRILTESGI